jgi:hypothetical protein
MHATESDAVRERAEAHDESVDDAGDRGVTVARDGRGRERIDHRHVLGPSRGRSDRSALRIDGEGSPVEEDVVVPADEVDENQRKSRASTRGGGDGASRVAFARVPRRRGEIHEDRSSGRSSSATGSRA